MTVYYYGDFDPNYARNRIMIAGLERNGIRVVRSRRESYDAVIVGYSDSRWTVPVAKLLFRKPIIWDAFYSLYDSWVFDRKLVSSRSLKAHWYWFLDWLSCKLADKILLDTDAHIEYFVKTFKIERSKFIRIFVGADDNVFHV
ncbi:MAG: hypothetical protein AAB420_00455 [Patescibacteria group bacterium]